jgi:16S rRNA processing protein RimM
MQQIAQVLKSNGTDGELVMSFRDIAPEDINLKETVFIYFDGLPVPFFFESFQKRGNSKALVHLTDIRDQEDVEELVGKAVYIEGGEEAELTLEEDGWAALVGWMVLTPSLGSDQTELDETEELDEESYESEVVNNEPELYEVGEITDFMDIPNNPCIELETINGAVIIPLHEDFILGLDPENREIIMDIPEGLL